MKFKFTLITLIITTSILHAYGQERTNREKLSFDRTSEALLKATGWANNTTLGEWVDYGNVICDSKDYKDKYPSLQGAYMMSQTSQNFLKVQTKTITFKDVIYYVLIVDKWSGQYKYPSIKQDWFEFKQTFGYIYTKEEYQKLLNLENLVELKTKNIVRTGLKYDEIVFLDLIQTELSKEKNEYSSEYTFPVMKSKEGAIRFYIPDRFSTYSNYDFENKYFETDVENFSKIILK